MKSRTTRRFWVLYERLPDDVRERAIKAYEQFRQDPAHPGLHFKRVSDSKPVYSVRIGLNHRAVGLLEADTVTWFWIGSHERYDRLLAD